MTGTEPRWFGNAPGDWAVCPVGFRYEVQLGKMLNPDATTGAGLAPYLRNTDVQWSKVNTAALPEMAFDARERLKFALRPGDLLVCEGGEVGRTAIWRGELKTCFYQKAIHRLRPWRNTEDPRFFYYAMSAAAWRGVFAAEGNKSTIAHLTAEKLRAHRFPFPRVEQQRAIADLLDRKTAAIDALIASKERLVALLEEKYDAAVTELVAGGLSRASHKPSNTSWPGTVPAHWTTGIRFSLLASRRQNSFVNGPFGSDLLTNELVPDGVPVIYIRDIREGRYVRISEVCVTEQKARQLHACRVDPGDVLIAKVGDPPGFAAVYPASEAPAVVTQDVIRVRVDGRRVLPEYLAMLLNSAAGRHMVEHISVESTRQRISLTDLKRAKLFLPPVNEQHRIVNAARTLLDDIALLRKMSASIGHLREYRQAVITAAVTGRLSVAAQPQEAA